MEKVYLKSEQKDIVVRNQGRPSFELRFRDLPLLVNKDIADLLVKQDPSNFSVVGESDAKKSGFEKPSGNLKLSKTDMKDMRSEEQVQWLLKHGVPSKDIPKKEDDRVQLILKLQEE